MCGKETKDEVKPQDNKEEAKAVTQSAQCEESHSDPLPEFRPTPEMRLKGTALLKCLLNTSTAITEKMITTTEVTDEKLNLKKILYQPDRENGQQVNISELQLDDDDRRLVIDIPDEKESKNDPKTFGKSMPSLNTSMEDENRGTTKLLRQPVLQRKPFSRHFTLAQDVTLPKTITYSLEATPTGGFNNNNSFKIDILAPAMGQIEMPSSTDKPLKVPNLQSPKGSKMTALDEMNVISHEIDKQITKKTNEILELLKEFLSGALERVRFSEKMREASDTALSDLMSIAKKLIKRHKFEPNPNFKEFMRIKFLQFPTSAIDIVIYFDNLLPSLNHEKFLAMIKFYEIIIKEMLNLNKTKILQYLIDFMIVRKNAQLDLLNFNYQMTSAPNLRPPHVPTTTKFQLPDSTQTPSERRPSRLHDTSYNFIIRSDPIYLQAGSSFVTNHRDVITSRMIPRVQIRNFELRPFDNNTLKGRRLTRRMIRSVDDEKLQSDFRRTRLHFPTQSEPATPTQQITIVLSPGIVESETPPPSLTSDPPSPLQQKVSKSENVSILIANSPEKLHETNGVEPNQAIRQTLKRRPTLRNTEIPVENVPNEHLGNSQITIHDIETLTQNGTEIIPTSILRNTILTRRKTDDYDRAGNLQIAKKLFPRGTSHEEQRATLTPTQPKQQLKRRQSCHERIMVSNGDYDDKKLENSQIGRNYMEFLHIYENEIKKNKQLEQQQQRAHMQYNQQHQPSPKRVRFSADVDTNRSPRHQHPNQIHFAMAQQQQMQLQQQQQQHQQQLQQQQQQMENQQQRLAQFQGNTLNSGGKPHPPPINYQYYQHQFERELRERGYDPRIESHLDPGRPLELVSHILPERYHQHEQQRLAQMAPNHGPQKQMRQMQEKPQRVQPRSSIDETQQAAIMAAAYHQLQSLHREHNLSPQQYAEHMKQVENMKHMQPSAFTAYQRNAQASLEEQRQHSEFFANSQEIRRLTAATSPIPYQISSSSSREESPNGFEILHKEQSLQRKLKYKGKSAKYVEPNQNLGKPFYNPPNSTYYSEPFAMTKSKPVAVSPQPTSTLVYHASEITSSRSPGARSAMEPNASSKAHYHNWLISQNLLPHNQVNQPQRPIPRPQVPTFIDTKANGTNHQIPTHYTDQPTEFLRKYYASQKHF